MAFLKNTIIAASVLAYYVSAVPVAAVHRRDMVTHTVTDWEIVNVQATVWVDDAGKPVKTDIPSVTGAVASKPTDYSSSSAAPSSTTPAAAIVAPVAPPPSSSSTSPAPAATYSPAGFAAQAAPEPAATTPAPVAPAPASPAAPAPAPSSTQLQQKASGSGGVCSGPGSGCSGDITHYDGGLGACGWNVNTNSDFQIALPYELMGTQSNGNPYCGKSLTIIGPSGTQVQATVGDKCMGCTGYSIDLTNALFTAVAPNGDGRVGGITWYFN